MKKTIAIITSDPESINYEIIKKSIFFFKKKKFNNYIFIGSKKLLYEHVGKNINNIKVVNINWKNKKNTKQYLKKSFNKFLNLYKKKKVHGLINLPLNKKKFLSSSYPGVTEYLAKKFNKSGSETMLLYNEKFSVSPVTTHIKIVDISKKLSKKKIANNFNNIYNFYSKILDIKKPKIAILGLNPHNGMDFSSKTEEQKIIVPIINYLNKKFKVKIEGPLSPDTSFVVREIKKINCLIGLYHDQILTTFKYICKFSAINITLGLPFVRMSPDHGTATDIIGKNKADPKSFLYCLNFFEKFHKTI